METSSAVIRRHIKLYWLIGLTLITFTVVTLAIGLMDLGAPGLTWEDTALGLSIAVTKASLVGLIFMHLNHERGLIYKVLLFTSIIALGLAFLTGFAQHDPIQPHVHIVKKVGTSNSEAPGRWVPTRGFRNPVPAETQ